LFYHRAVNFNVASIGSIAWETWQPDQLRRIDAIQIDTLQICFTQISPNKISSSRSAAALVAITLVSFLMGVVGARSFTPALP